MEKIFWGWIIFGQAYFHWFGKGGLIIEHILLICVKVQIIKWSRQAHQRCTVMHNHSWFIFYINLFLLKQKEYCMLYFKKVIFWLWNCKYAYFGFSVSKFLQKFHILKGDKTNIMAWRFHRIFFIEKRKIIEILKPWCSVVFQVENKMCQEFCNAANGDMYCCSYTINLQVYIVFAFKFFLTVKMPGTLLIVILFINFGDDIVNISIFWKYDYKRKIQITTANNDYYNVNDNIVGR